MCCSSRRSSRRATVMSSRRSQHALTRDKLPEMGEATGFAQTFLIDGKVPAQGAVMKQAGTRRDARSPAKAGLDDFYRGDVGREIAADLERIGSPVTRADLEKYQRLYRRSAVGEAANRHALQCATADAGAGLAHHPCAVRTPARAGSRRFRFRARPCRIHQARVSRARSRGHRSESHRGAARSAFVSCFPRYRGAENRTQESCAVAGASRERAIRSGWAPPTRPGSWSPISSRSIGNSARAACCRAPAS